MQVVQGMIKTWRSGKKIRSYATHVQRMDSTNWISLEVEKNGQTDTVFVTENMANLLFSETVDQNTKDSLLQNICKSQHENACSPSTSKLPESDNRNEFLDKDSTSDVFDPDQRKEELNPPCRAVTSGISEKTSKWTHAAEKLLLAKHKEIEESKLPIKNKWKKISDDMHCNNYDFSPEQCRLKIKTIKEKYERNKKKNNTSGESPADSDDELGEIFEKLPDMNPVFLLESKASKSPSPDQCGSSDPENCKKKRTLSPTPDHTDALEGQGKKKARRSVDIMKTFFTEAIERKEEAIERRHKEKINTINSLVGVLKDLVKK